MITIVSVNKGSAQNQKVCCHEFRHLLRVKILKEAARKPWVKNLHRIDQ